MNEQPGKGRGDEPSTDLTPRKEPTYEGYFFGDEEDAGREAGGSGEEGDEVGRERGGEGEGAL